MMPCPLHDTVFWDRKTHQEHVYQHYALLKEEKKKLDLEKKRKEEEASMFFELVPHQKLL